MPANLGITWKTRTSALIEWQEPADTGNSPVQAYILEMKEADRRRWRTLPVQGRMCKYTVKDLTEDTKYTFQLAVKNYEGLQSVFTEQTVCFDKCEYILNLH